MGFHALIFGHHVQTEGLIPMISYILYPIRSLPQLCRNRLEDVINLSNTILLPIAVQVYEFHGISEKLKKPKSSIATNKKVTNRVV